MRFTLCTSTIEGSTQNCVYPHKKIIADENSLAEAAKYDHVTAEYRNSYRSSDNFIQSDCIPMDCDNDNSEDEKAWVTPLEVSLAFPDVSFAVVYSRNNMKAKGTKVARPKFHVYFPIQPCTNVKEYTDIKKQIAAHFKHFDENALDSARFLFGTDKPKVELWEGSRTVTDFIYEDAFSAWEKSLEEVPEGKRNSTMSHFAGRILKRFGNTEKAYELFLKKAEKCTPPLPEEELKTIWHSAVKFGEKVENQEGYIPPEKYNSEYKLKPLDYSDVGQATIMAKEYVNMLRYSPATDYLVYNGSYWEESRPKSQAVAQELTYRQLEEAEVEMKKVMQEMMGNGAWEVLVAVGPKKAPQSMNEKQLNSFKKYQEAVVYRNYAIKRRDSKYITSALKEVRPMLEIEQRILDTDEYLLNTPTFTFDLQIGINGAREHNPMHLITKQTAVDPSEEGMSLWQDALDTIFEKDTSLIQYVQEVTGLAAIGKVYEESLIISYGEGRNGKSTFWNVISRVLGSYSGNISADVLTVGCKRNVKPELAEAKGKRLLIAAELEVGKEGTNTYNFAVKSGVMGSDNIVTGDGNRVIGNDNNDGDKSQVFILGNSVTAGLANSVYLGDSSSYVVAGTTTSGDQAYGSLTVGTTTYNFAGATPAGVVTVGGIGSERRIQNVAAGLVTAGSTDAVNGSQLYALTRPLKFKGDNSTVISRGSDEQLNIVGGANQANLSDNNIGVIGDGTTLNIKLAKDLTGLTSVTTVMNNNGITMGGGVSLTTTDGLNNGGKTITNVAPGTAGTDAVNVNQLNTAATKATTTVSAGSNINVTPTTAADGHTEYNVKLKDTVTLGTGVNQVTMDGTTGTISAGTGTNQVVFNGVTGQGSVGKVNINGSVGRVGGLTNTDWGPGYTMVSGQAATEDQLQKATQGLTNAGLNFAGNTGSTNKKLGETMTIQGGYTGTAASDENVKTVVNTDGTMSIQLAKDAKFDSVTTGDTVINNNGLTIGTGATAIIINKGNINMGDNIIHGVADGVDGKDAVNKDQLDKAAAGSKTTVSAGSNIYVTKTDGADGEPDNYEVSLKDKITLGTTPENQVTIDGTTGTISAGANIAFNGVTGMGNIGNIKFDGSGSVGEISGLTNTTIVAGVTGEGTRAGVAATEGQLKALNNIIDGGLNFAGDDYVSTDSNTVINKKLGEQLNIIGGETTLASGGPAKNIKTAKNAAGDLEIILGSELELNKVTMGNTYLDENGLYFGGYGPTNVYLTKDGGLHNGGYTITGVGNGINDDDAVNMSQLKDATAVATTTVSDGKNTTVTSKLNDNGSTDYQVNLNDNSTLGSQDGTGNYVNINGTDGKIVVAGENGNKITIDGNKGEIGGLTNTDFVVGTTGEGDRAGVAATEGQLKDIYDNLDGKIEQNKTDITNLDNRVTKNEGDIANIQGDIEKIENRVTKVEGDTIKSGAIDENTGKISLERNDGTSFELEGTLSDESLQGGNDDGLGNYKADADGKVTMQVKDKYSGEERDVTIADVASKAKLDDLTGAVGVGSKDEMKDKYKDTNYIKDADDMAGADVILDKEIKNNSDRLDQQGDQINNLNNSVNRLGNRVDKVGAGAAALAALHPLDFDPDEKLTFAAGVGNYRGETAASIGAFYRPDEKVMLSLGGTVGNGENMVNMGVSFALDRTSNVNNSKVALAKEVVDLRKQVADLTLLVMQNVGQGRENLDVNRLFPDVAENHWAYEYVADLAKQGIIEGYPDGNFGGDRMMTRYEFAAMLYRAMEKGANVDSKIINEFEAELGRIRVDRISGQDDDKHKVERVRVNGGKTRDKYGSEIAAQ